MTKSALQIVQNFQDAMVTGGSDCEALISKDIIFKGPVDTVKGQAAFIELNKGFMPLVQNYASKNMIEQGNFAVLEGTYTVSTPAGKTIDLDTMEMYETHDGLIQNVRIYYDAEEFRKEFAPVN